MKGFKGFDKNLVCRDFQYEIGHALSILISSGYLESGCFNDDSRDRTKWYTNGRKGRSYDFSCK